MAHQWFVVWNGKEAGPFTAQELKSLGYEGRLLKVDLVRRDDMKTAVQAYTIKGLFPEPQPVSNVPPPLPTGYRPPVFPPDNFFTPADKLPPNSHQAATPPPLFNQQSTQVGNAPALWNPRVVTAWSVLLFSWAFGAILTAKNWRALGDNRKAQRSMLWFYALFPYFLLCVILPASLARLFREVPLAVNLVWLYFESLPQQKFVKERIGENYRKKSWTVPLAIAVPIVGLVAIGMFANVSDDSTVALVRTGYLKDYPGTPIGIAFDHFLGNPRWDSGKSSTGQMFVNVEGDMTYADKPVHAAVQFLVNPTAGRFEVGAFELNGVPQNQLLTMGLIAKVFEDFRK